MNKASDFYKLNFPQQADLLQTDGFFLFARNEGRFIIDLYELDDLLVEIYYHMESEEPVSILAGNTVEKLKTLQAGNIQPRLVIRGAGSAYQNGRHAA
jgi:hypothetical protein